MNTALRHSWERAWRGAGAAGAGSPVYADLVARYSESHRAYHTLQHLGECLALFESVTGLATHPPEVELALWFHDAVYDVRASDNEEASASLATATLAGAGVSRNVVDRVRALVMATRHRAVPTDTDEQLLVDIDLAILGAPAERFAEYEAQIRTEYRHVPGILYRYRRRSVLRSFLDRPTIYSTPHFQDLLEACARENLARAAG